MLLAMSEARFVHHMSVLPAKLSRYHAHATEIVVTRQNRGIAPKMHENSRHDRFKYTMMLLVMSAARFVRMRPDTPRWKWMPTSPSTYGQGLARPARLRHPPETFPLVGASEKQGPGTKFSSFVPGTRDKTHVPGWVTR